MLVNFNFVYGVDVGLVLDFNVVFGVEYCKEEFDLFVGDEVFYVLGLLVS